MFEPWEGPAYRQADNIFGGRRLLVLGESHYTDKPEEVGTSWPDFTQWCVRKYPINGKNNRFYDNVVRILFVEGQSNKIAEYRRLFWNSVAYFNFVPVCVDGCSTADGGNNRRPTTQMFELGAKLFLPVLRRLDPEAVIVCGLQNWEWVAPQLDSFSGSSRDVIYYDDGKSIFARIQHPSYRNFNPEYWKERINYLLDQAAKPRQRGAKVVWPALCFG